jgi:hypothetical protein
MIFFLFVPKTTFITQNQKKKNVRPCVKLYFFIRYFFGLLYSRVGAGAPGAASKFLPEAGAA